MAAPHQPQLRPEPAPGIRDAGRPHTADTANTAAEVDALLAATVRTMAGIVSDRVARSPWAQDNPAGLPPLTGGKCVRARAFLTAASAYGALHRPGAQDALVGIAAALELLHTASLVHDDIIDASSTRRGAPALHRLTSPATAILVGDQVFALALAHSAPYGVTVTAALTRAFADLCEGQLLESALRWDADALPVLERYGSLKTGALFGAAFELAAHVAGLPDPEQLSARDAGIRLGLAFQFADDLLDIHGDLAELGKDHGADLRNGVPSFPLWLASQQLATEVGLAHPTDLDALAATASSASIDARTRTRIAELVAEARSSLPAAPDPELLEAAIHAVVAVPLSAPAPSTTTESEES